MNIIVYYAKKDFDTQKVLRFFKERRVKVQEIDIKKAPMTFNMLRNISNSIKPAGDIFDRESMAFKESPARFSGSDDLLLESAARDNKMLRLPIARNGNAAAIGYQPEVFERWIEKGGLTPPVK